MIIGDVCIADYKFLLLMVLNVLFLLFFCEMDLYIEHCVSSCYVRMMVFGN